MNKLLLKTFIPNIPSVVEYFGIKSGKTGFNCERLGLFNPIRPFFRFLLHSLNKIYDYHY